MALKKIGKISESKGQGLKKVGTLFKEESKDSITKILSSSRPIPDTGDPIINALLTTQKEFVGPIVQGANTALFGLPKFVSNKISPQFSEETFPEQSTLLGKTSRVGSEILGLFGGAGARLSAKIGAKAIPRVASNIGLKSLPGTISAFKRANLAKNIGRGALEGAVFGGVQIFDPETTLEQQVLQSGAGAIGGAVIPALGSGTKKLVRQFKNFTSIPKRSALTRLSERAKGLKGESSIKINALRKTAAREIDETKTVLNQNKKNLEDKIFESAQQGVKDIQPTLKQFSKSMSDAYGKQVDDISTAMINKGKAIKKSEFNDFLNEVASELDSVDALNPEALAQLKVLRGKFGIKFIGKGSKFRSAKTGEAIGGAIKSNADETIPFKRIVDEVKTINNLFSNQLKSTGQINQGDVQVAILRKNFGKLLGEDFSQLNKEYGQAAKAIKNAYRIFKPSQAEFGTSRGVRELQKIATGRQGAGEAELLDFLQQGTSIGGRKIQGIPNVTDELLDLGNQLTATKKLIQQSAKTIKLSTDNKIQQVRKQLERQLAGIDNRKQIIQDILAGKELKEATIRNIRNIGGTVLTLAGVLALLSALRGSKK